MRRVHSPLASKRLNRFTIAYKLSAERAELSLGRLPQKLSARVNGDERFFGKNLPLGLIFAKRTWRLVQFLPNKRLFLPAKLRSFWWDHARARAKRPRTLSSASKWNACHARARRDNVRVRSAQQWNAWDKPACALIWWKEPSDWPKSSIGILLAKRKWGDPKMISICYI